MEHGHGENCGCHGHAGHPGKEHHGGCCHGQGHGGRRFFTREETIKHLEDYLAQLKAETTGVEEELARLKG